jgi:FtsP/CotA-like multicopper oxidase with cupredoxin domain
MKGRNFLTRVGLSLAAAVLVCSFDPGSALAQPVTTPGSVPDYWETPNWAFSPPLRKFMDSLPGLNSANNLGQMIPVAIPDTSTYPGSDYYEIELVQFREQMHTDLPAVAGDKMAATSGGTLLRGYRQFNTNDVNLSTPHYLGPQIIATKNRPVRIKFINSLPTGTGGKLFLPVDGTIMGSGSFEIDYDPETKAPKTLTSGTFSQNRATLHLHGGHTPWISDGTPHQWITPAGESTTYPKGVSVAYVPDMWFDASGNTITACAGQTTCATAGATNNPGPGAETFYYTNEQSSRLLFYHDHAWGITRLNVYAGEAAGYLITDQVEQAMINGGTVNGKTFAQGTLPDLGIPLIIQDKTFVDTATITTTDPTWAWGSQPWNGTPGAPMTPVQGDLWWPHVYMPAENPYDITGAAALGRWVYGPWFFPPTPVCGSSANAVKPFCIDVGTLPNPYFGAANPNQPPEIPGTPNVSWGAEAFLDTMLVNGTAYPYLNINPQTYRFRILNAAHDRFLNLQLYVADPSYAPGTPGYLTEVKMVPAATTAGFPAGWPEDGREGGVPDPAYRGPAFIQVGTESGFLAAPVVLPNRPVKWNTDVTMFNAGNVLQQNQGGGTLFLGPAERVDVVVDFSQFAGKTLILYNDAPAPWPALDPHYDYYTGAPDRTDIGGAPSIPAGFGPNIRTIMQFKVSGSGGIATPDYYNPATLSTLQTAFTAAPGAPGVFALGQNPIAVGQTAYNSAYNTTFPSTYPNWGVARITDDAISYQQVDGTIVSNYQMKRKAIHDEMGGTFDDYGRLAAKLGLEIPFANAALQNFVLQNFVDPPTELVRKGEVQIWRITHNGVDTHPVHFHLFDVQVLNRVGWDGFIRLPDPNEIGWKDTVRVSPLEDTIVALKPKNPTVPFALPNSIRPLNPSQPIGSMIGFSQTDTNTGGNLTPPQTNQFYNFGFEYVWHCHILSHEENDMMRSLVLNPNVQDEILWRNNTDGQNLVWYLNGTTQTGWGSLPTLADQSWQIVGRGDFNGDGKRDIIWRNTSGQNIVWYMDGTSQVGWGALPTLGNNWQLAGTADFNGDGKPDLCWRETTTGQNIVWYMNGVSQSGWGEIPSLATVWQLASTADFNGDGKPDLFWRNTSTGQNVVWYMNGVSQKSWGLLPTLSFPTNLQVAAVGDFNNDVYNDILWRDTVTGENTIWFLNGLTQIGTGSLPTVPVQWLLEGK